MRGSSLVETILAVFILVIAVSFTALSFHRSLRYQNTIQRKAQGIAFSETVIDQVREWAQTPANYSGPWTSWSSFTLPDYPGFEARIRQDWTTLTAPCSQIALGKLVAERQEMNNSMKRLDVSILYNGQVETQFQAFVGEPERLAVSVQVTPVIGIPDPLVRDGLVEFKAEALDSAGNSIPDVFFLWSSEPITGNGTVISTGRGQTANLANLYLAPDGATRYSGGQVRVKALCKVRGREVWGFSSPVNLQP